MILSPPPLLSPPFDSSLLLTNSALFVICCFYFLLVPFMHSSYPFSSLTNVSYECLLRMSLTNVSSSRRLFFKSFIYRYRTTVEFVKRNLRVRFSINGATRARRGNGVPNQTTHTTNQAGNHSFLSLAYYVLAKLTLSSLKHWIIAALR